MANKKILFVENIDLAVQIDQEIIKRGGLEALTARTGAEALTLVSEHKPDLIVLDMDMPDMSGAECCAAMKQSKDSKKTPIILMLANPTAESMQICFSANCDEILTKPLNHQEVVDKMTTLLGISTRKFARLNLKTPVRVDFEDQNWLSESMNLNRQGMLVSSSQTLSAGQNYILTFVLVPEQPSISIRAKLERHLPPGEAKNPGPNHLGLFRFMALDQETGNLIDQLAEAQAFGHDMSNAQKQRPAVNIPELQAALLKPYQEALEALKEVHLNLESQPAGVSPTNLDLIRKLSFSLKTWEKKALTGSDEDDLALAAALGVSLKMLFDHQVLSALPSLTEAEQAQVKEIQKEYFKVPDEVLENLQERINAQMQSKNVDMMKNFNSTKTNTFKNYVNVKSILNRILDPKAALEASQFQYQGDGDSHQVTTYQRGKVIEEAPKKAEVYARLPDEHGRPIFKYIFLGLLWATVPFAFYFFNFRFKIPYRSNALEASKITMTTPLPVREIKVIQKDTGKTLLVFMTADWEKFDLFRKQELAKEAVEESKKDYEGIMLYKSNNQKAAEGNPATGLKFYDN